MVKILATSPAEHIYQDLMDSCVAHLFATLTPHSADTSHEEPVGRNRINFDVTQTLGASIKEIKHDWAID